MPLRHLYYSEASLNKMNSRSHFSPFQRNGSVVPINLDTVMAKLHVFHLCDIWNAIKSWLWKCADFLAMKGKGITPVINMQTSSRWQSRLGFENLNYFCVIIYLPVHRSPFFISTMGRPLPPPSPPRNDLGSIILPPLFMMQILPTYLVIFHYGISPWCRVFIHMEEHYEEEHLWMLCLTI